MPQIDGKHAGARGKQAPVLAIAQPLELSPALEALGKLKTRKDSWNAGAVVFPVIWEQVRQSFFFEVDLQPVQECHRSNDEKQGERVLHQNAKANHHGEGTDVEWVARQCIGAVLGYFA